MLRPRYYIPRSYAQHILRIVNERGIDVGDLETSPILEKEAPAVGGDAGDFGDYKQFIADIEARVGDPCLGLDLGTEVPFTAHRFLGYAIFCSATLEEAFNVAIKYLPVLYNVLEFELLSGDTEATVRIYPVAELGKTANFMVDMSLSAIATLIRSFGNGLGPKRVHLTRPESGSAGAYRECLQCEVVFAAPYNEIQFDEHILHLPSGASDSASFQLAIEQCDRELASLQAQQSVALAVSALLKKHPEKKPGLDEIAQSLKVSPRTLRRRLHDEKTNFQSLQKQVGIELACEYLSGTNWSVGNIAERLGYENASSFGKAFRNWTGQTPREYRDANPHPGN